MPMPLPPPGAAGKPPAGNPELPSTSPLISQLLAQSWYWSGGTLKSAQGFNIIQALPSSTVLYPTAQDAHSRKGGMTVGALKAAENPTPQLPGTNWLAAIGDFFSRLGQANTWLRVGEVLLGVVLIGVGVARITGTQNAVSQLVKARIPA